MKSNRAAHRRKARKFVWMPLQRITVERGPFPSGEVIRITAINTYAWRRMRVTRGGYRKPTNIVVMGEFRADDA